MQVSIEKSTGLERRLTVQVPGDQLQKQIDSRLREIGKQVKIKGFRPGRVPFKVLRQRYGKSVQQEIMAQAVQSSLMEAIEQESLRPASSPVLEGEPDLQPGGDLHYTASVEVFPEIGPIDVSGIAIDSPDAEVTDDDIDDMLETLRTQRQSWRELERAAVEGDQVTVDYAAETDAGRVPEEGHHRIGIVLGQSGFEQLEQVIAHLAPGQETNATLTFPEGYREAKLAGRKADVEVKVVKVQAPELPDVDEEFIKSFGVESGSLDDLKNEIRSNLERELKQARTSYLKVQLVDRLLAMHGDLEVPEALVRDEAQGMQRRASDGDGGEPQEADLEPFLEPARNRVKSGLLLGEIARQNNIMVDGARVRQAIETVAETYEHPQEVVRLYYGERRLLKSVENAVLEEQVVDWVLDYAKTAPKRMSMNEVINAAASGGRSQ